MDIKESIQQVKIICSCRGIFGEDLISCMQAVLLGGVKMIDLAFQQDKTDSFTEIAESLKLAKHIYGDKLFLGAGNVLTCEQVELSIQAGANYIISPVFDKDVVKMTKENNLFSIVGALTPSEIHEATKFGADMIMLYPTGIFGADYLKYIIGKGPLSDVDVIACGGVNTNNLKSLLDAGCQAAVIGQYLADKELIKQKEYEKITLRAKELVSIANGDK